MIKCFPKKKVYTLCILFLALHGCLDVTEILLSRCEYKPDTKDSCGTTPLMDALRAGHTDIAQLLVAKHGVSTGVVTRFN